MPYMYLGRKCRTDENGNVVLTNSGGVICLKYGADMTCRDLVTTDVAIAFCSPKDAFSKPKARAILDGRDKKGMHAKIMSDSPSVIAHEIRELLNGHYARIANVPVPDWARSVL